MNTGLDLKKELEHDSSSDYKYGAFSPVPVVNIPISLRAKYLPDGELQKAKEDTKSCATYAPTEKLEADFTYFYQTTMQAENKKWLEDNGYVNNNHITFSKRFIAILSGTTQQGNSLIAPLQAMNDNGLIPEALLPLVPTMTFAEWIDPSCITPDIKHLGQQFNSHFHIYYEKVYAVHTQDVLKDDMLVTCGYAWPEPVNGEYPRVEYDFNHVFLKIWPPPTYIFDTYYDSVDGDFIKKLASNYKFLDYDYHVFISAEYTALTPEKISKITVIIGQINSILQNILVILKKKVAGYFGDIIK